MEGKVEDLIDKISIMEYELDSKDFTVADANVLSVALKKLFEDRDKLTGTMRLNANNTFDDMNKYYKNKLNRQYKDLCSNCDIVVGLFKIAKDKERESLLQYLGR